MSLDSIISLVIGAAIGTTLANLLFYYLTRRKSK